MKIIAKKSLGQNFLRDPKILQKIVTFAQINKTDMVVEVGPGEGTLTKLLIDRAKKVVAIEKDEDLARKLQEKFREEITDNRLQIMVGDALDTNIYNLMTNDYILVGNIPYYITGALFKKFLESENPPKSITFVVQKEVALRIMARDHKESILSISIKAFGKPEYGGLIKAGSFMPAPKVDSAIIAVRNIGIERFKDVKIERFFEIVRAGFAHKRKFLIKNLENMVKNPLTNGEKLKEIFKKCDISEKARAEDLVVEQWFKISDIINE